jgi:hypothetical protein
MPDRRTGLAGKLKSANNNSLESAIRSLHMGQSPLLPQADVHSAALCFFAAIVFRERI